MPAMIFIKNPQLPADKVKVYPMPTKTPMEMRLSFDHLEILKHDISSENPQFSRLKSR